jgi:signal transduction histidine kinase
VPTQADDQLEVLWTQAQRLNRLIDTFVDISNVERGSLAMNLGKVEIVSVLKRAVDQSLAQDRYLHEIVLDTPPALCGYTPTAKRLEQVFSHVLSNALRYSPEHRPVMVALEDQRANGKVLVSIADDGPGIPPTALSTYLSVSIRRTC